MNTMVKIKSCNRRSAIGKNQYNLTRLKNGEADIFVIAENDFPPAGKSLSATQKLERKNLQCRLKVYEKRLVVATKKGKEKSIKTVERNLTKIKKSLKKMEGAIDDREKYFTEFTIALTNSYAEDISMDWSLNTLNYIKQKYPELVVISAVEHRDQNSPHMHILLYHPDKPITQYLAEANGQADTKRESMKLAYSQIAHDYHDWAQEGVVEDGVQLDPLVKGRKYVSLGRFKSGGNFEVQLKEKERIDAERRDEERDRGIRLDGIRERAFGIWAEIKELDAEAIGVDAEVAEIADGLISATATAKYISDSVKRIGDLLERVLSGKQGTGGILSEEQEHKLLMEQVWAKNGQKRDLNGKSPNQSINKTPKP